MSDYDFKTLNDKDFEVLVLDLLNSKYQLGLQSFKPGRDQGVDMRLSTSFDNNSIVVQAKHYIGSTYSQLKHSMKNTELEKVKKINPSRYIVATSLALTAKNKDELKEVLNPYVLSSNDIISSNDLNAILRANPEVEKAHFKLWFSSAEVLDRILNNAVESRTSDHLKRIQGKIKFYVITKNLDDALKILDDNHVLLITGQPGIGKTTLANTILFERAKKNYKIHKVENIREAEDVLSADPDEKQLFYFDDFLGANCYEIVHADKTESQIASFVERIKNSANKYLVLTTRTVILNHAIEKHEKIKRSRISDNQFELKLDDYDRYEKALILYNHLFFNEVGKEHYDSLLTDKFYKKIISHLNYTPRIIEFITEKSKIDTLTTDQYRDFILANLKNPKEIWSYSFNNQIEYFDRCLLLTLLTFSKSVAEKHLIKSFESRLNYEKLHHNQILESDQFNKSISILLNGFITSTLITKPKLIREYSFINPSLGDFLIEHIQQSIQERKSIITSLIYVEQFKPFSFYWKIHPLEHELQEIIVERVSKGLISSIAIESSYYGVNQERSNLLDILFSYCPDVDTDGLMLSLIKKIDFTGDLHFVSRNLESLLLELTNAPLTQNHIASNFRDIVEGIIGTYYDLEDAEKIPLLFKKYGQDFQDYQESHTGSEILRGLIKGMLRFAEDEFVDERQEEIKDIRESELLDEKLGQLEETSREILLPEGAEEVQYELSHDIDFWSDKVQSNNARFLKEEENAMDYEEDYRYHAFEAESVEQSIEDLFDKG